MSLRSSGNTPVDKENILSAVKPGLILIWRRFFQKPTWFDDLLEQLQPGLLGGFELHLPIEENLLFSPENIKFNCHCDPRYTNDPCLLKAWSHFNIGWVECWQDASGDSIELKKVNSIVILMHMELQFFQGCHLEGLCWIGKVSDAFKPDFLPPSPAQTLPAVLS